MENFPSSTNCYCYCYCCCYIFFFTSRKYCPNSLNNWNNDHKTFCHGEIVVVVVAVKNRFHWLFFYDKLHALYQLNRNGNPLVFEQLTNEEIQEFLPEAKASLIYSGKNTIVQTKQNTNDRKLLSIIHKLLLLLYFLLNFWKKIFSKVIKQIE